MDTEVIVIGAGTTGLTLACALQSAGISVRLLDAASGPATTSRALGLQPRGVEVLDRLGALAHLPSHGIPVDRVIVHVNGRELAQLKVTGRTRLNGPTGLLMSQADIEAALRDRLTALGGSVEWGRRVSAVAARTDQVDVQFDDGPTLSAGWLVGADGAHSMVRKSMDIGFPGVPLIERFLLADVRAEIDRPRDATHAWLRGTDMFAAFPLPGEALWRLMSPAPQGMSDDPVAADIVAELGSNLAATAGGTIRSVEWTSSFRIQRRLADRYRQGRVLLAGDAAHIHSPFGGQGMNTGIGDAENLAWKLALVIGGHAADSLLDTYETERRPIAADVLSTTSGLTGLITGDGRVARLVRDRIAVPLANRPWLQRLIIEKSSQLQVSYRRGPLGNGQRLPSRGVRAGDRIPDRPGVRADGTNTRLYAELGPQWVAVGPSWVAASARDRLGDLVTAVDEGAEAALIRPDGHLAWRGCEPESLVSWLDNALGSHSTAAKAPRP